MIDSQAQIKRLLTMTEEPKPGTYGAIVRTTEPWDWRRMSEYVMLTPERFAVFLAQLNLQPSEPSHEESSDKL